MAKNGTMKMQDTCATLKRANLSCPLAWFVFLGFAGFSNDCLAEGILYFDISPLPQIVLGVICALFVLVGRFKGFIVFLVLLGAFFGWVKIQNYLQNRSSHIARQTISDKCLNNAGEEGVSLSYVPEKVYVRIDDRLRPGADSKPLRLSISRVETLPEVEFVSSFPEGFVARSAYVNIDVINEQIEGAADWRLRGLKATISNAERKSVASRIDYERDYSWCLGSDPSGGLNSFVRTRIGREIGILSPKAGGYFDTAIASPKGTVKKIEKGHFYEATYSNSLNVEQRAKLKFDLIPSYAGCIFEFQMSSTPSAVCMRGSQQQNRVNLANLSVTHDLKTSWLSIYNLPADAYYVDAVSIEERSRSGTVIGKWVVRFPRIEKKEDQTHFDVRNVEMNERQFSADLVFSAKRTFFGPGNIPNAYKEWFEFRTKISAPLRNIQGP